jgi:hypothetical protein
LRVGRPAVLTPQPSMIAITKDDLARLVDHGMPNPITEIVKGVLLSVMLVISLLVGFSFAGSSNLSTTKAHGVLKASGSFTFATFITYPTADAYVQEGYPTTNYGTDSKIIARSRDYPGTGGYGQMRGFFKFDISSIPAGATIVEAKLRLHCYYITNYIKNVSDLEIRRVTDSSWVENSIDWSNQPAYGSVCSNIILLNNDSWAGNHPVDNWYENDVTSFVKDQFDNGVTTISLMIRCMQEYYDNLYYRGSYYDSREADLENRPTLIVVVAVPATIGIDPNTLNLKSKGEWITCYIELPLGYSVENINVSTVKLTVGNKSLPAELWQTGIGDYDNDGIPDLMVKFNRSAVRALLSVGNVEVTVTGEVNGIRFEGRDNIRVINPGK